jgi:hypothetical protein
MITRVAKIRITNRRKKKYTFPTYNIDDIYKDFNNKQLELEETKRIIISLQKYKNIAHLCNKELSKMIATEGSFFNLPYNLGTLSISKDKVKYQDNELKSMFDFAHFKKTGEKKLHLLKDEDYRARWWWGKRKCKVKNKNMYSFTPTRTNTAKVSVVMKQPFGYNTYLSKSKL